MKTSGVLKNLSAKGLKIGIVASRFNREITEKLLRGAERILLDAGMTKEDITLHWVPGAFEIPLMLQAMLKKLAGEKKYDGLIALGAVVRGQTPHFDYVAGEAASGVMRVMLDSGIPIAFGVLTTDTVKQALDRAGGRYGNKGEESAQVIIEMISKFRS